MKGLDHGRVDPHHGESPAKFPCLSFMGRDFSLPSIRVCWLEDDLDLEDSRFREDPGLVEDESRSVRLGHCPALGLMSPGPALAGDGHLEGKKKKKQSRYADS